MANVLRRDPVSGPSISMLGPACFHISLGQRGFPTRCAMVVSSPELRLERSLIGSEWCAMEIPKLRDDALAIV